MKKALLTGLISVSALLLSCGTQYEPYPDFIGRHGHSAVVSGGKMYVFGGYGSGDFLNDLWVYDPTAAAPDEWAQLNPPSPPPPRDYHTAVVDGSGNIYVFGGYSKDEALNDVYYNDLWMYTRRI